MWVRDELDPQAPQREAALFYGLFMRGHSPDSLRRDIDVPKPVLEKWFSAHRYEPGFKDNLKRLVSYRKRVLAIFDQLVENERHRAPLQ